MKNKGFTLIELIAVLVIMAILALIVTPLVMSIIRKARISAAKRSIDAYGRSIELAIAGYLMDTGAFPTSIEQLTIEYSGPEVVCSTTQLNSDSSVYLTGCTVAGKIVDYTYGKYEAPTYDSYSVGDEVTYNNIVYYVIKDSSASESTVTLLKSVPLTVEEVNLYGGVGTINNHVNVGTEHSNGTAYDNNGYGGMTYFSSSTCGRTNDLEHPWIYDGCTTEYGDSDAKYVVDAWASVKTNLNDLAVDSVGYKARLITVEELRNNLGYGDNNSVNDNVPSWSYNSNYAYWTMTPKTDDPSEWYRAYVVTYNGGIDFQEIYGRQDLLIRPVITIKKSAL